MELMELDTDVSWCEHCGENVETELRLNERYTPFEEESYTETCCECGRVL